MGGCVNGFERGKSEIVVRSVVVFCSVVESWQSEGGLEGGWCGVLDLLLTWQTTKKAMKLRHKRADPIIKVSLRVKEVRVVGSTNKLVVLLLDVLKEWLVVVTTPVWLWRLWSVVGEVTKWSFKVAGRRFFLHVYLAERSNIQKKHHKRLDLSANCAL